ncbi:MAG: hypothetical protein WC290_02965 [archaeon]|jgi:hypothetical protein|nr:hypothetical protein [Candidatus ainarchaeum sp.]HPM85497.1 hypothetical protein [archaeon]
MVTKIDYDKYLASKTAELIRENFPEKGITNILIVKWSTKKSKRILGHIKSFKDINFGSIIEINPLLKDLSVPQYVLDYVLMHELTHYFQGFGSNHERKHKYPHKGGIVEKELARHGWEEITQKSEKWIKENWKNLICKKTN